MRTSHRPKRRVLDTRSPRRKSSRDSARHLRFEPLEHRHLLATLTVTSLLDNGAGGLTLREAIAAAGFTDTIVFASGLTGTIALTNNGTGHLAIDKSLTIQGPGPDLLTIKAFDPDADGTNDNDGRRIFFVYNNTVPITVTISGLTLTNGDPQQETEDTSGGAIFNRDTLTISNCVITGNSSLNGGAISNSMGNVTINDCVISNNLAQDGAGILNTGGSMTINRTVIQNNDAANVGGGILKRNGTLNVTDSTISGNGANSDDEFSGAGGGIASYGGALNLTSSTISGNAAGNVGGGLYLSAGNLTIANSTISGNSATNKGGGIYSNTTNTINLRHSTITANTVAGGGTGAGISSLEATNEAVLTHTLVAGNLHGGLPDDLAGTFAVPFSLLGTTTGATLTTTTGSVQNVADALLGPLADNGGLTKTHELLPGSPARNAGDPAAVPGSNNVPIFDQRGTTFSRILDGRIDIGAMEMPAPPPEPELPGDYNRDTVVDAADYVVWRKTLGATVVQYEGADGDGDTTIDDGDYAVWSENFGETLPPGAGGGVGEPMAANSSSVADASGAVGWFDSPSQHRSASAIVVRSPALATEEDSHALLLRALNALYSLSEAPSIEGANEADGNAIATQDSAVDSLFGDSGDELEPAWTDL